MSGFKPNFTKFDFRRGSANGPRWGSLQRSARLPAWLYLRGLILRGEDGKEEREKGWEEEGRGKGREREVEFTFSSILL